MPAARWKRCPDWRPPSAPPGLCVRGCAGRGADGDGDSAAGSHNPASLVRLSDPGPLAMLAHRGLSANLSLLHTSILLFPSLFSDGPELRSWERGATTESEFAKYM